MPLIRIAAAKVPSVGIYIRKIDANGRRSNYKKIKDNSRSPEQ